MSTYELAGASSLRTFFQGLSNGVIQQKLGRDIYQKGFYYYEDDAVEEIEVVDACTVKAKVYGSEKYKVKIWASSGSVQAKCSCPYGDEWDGMCKHIAAVLIKALHDKLWKEIPEVAVTATASSQGRAIGHSNGDTLFETWLNSLSIEELRQTIHKLATPAFRKEIQLRYSHEDQRAQVFLAVKKKIHQAIKQLGNYDGGQRFEEKLKPLLKKLRGIWTHNPEEVKVLFLQIIAAVNEADDDGSMFDPYSEETFDGSYFTDSLCDFLNELPDHQRLAFLPVFWKAIGEGNYDTFFDFFTRVADYLRPGDWPEIKVHLMDCKLIQYEEFAEKVYRLFEAIIPTEEKGQWLKTLVSKFTSFTLPLALFFEETTGDMKKAAKILDKAIDQQLSNAAGYNASAAVFQPMLEERFRMAIALKESLAPLVMKYLTLLPSATSLQRAIALTPEQTKNLEQFLCEKNIHEYLAYLESEMRLAEIVPIIEKTPASFRTSYTGNFSRYDFYVRHKRALPEKALNCFREQLNEELAYTGDVHYRLVTDALKNMQPLIPGEEFLLEISNIRFQYKRRTNLMTLLNKAFGK